MLSSDIESNLTLLGKNPLTLKSLKNDPGPNVTYDTYTDIAANAKYLRRIIEPTLDCISIPPKMRDGEVQITLLRRSDPNQDLIGLKNLP